MRWILLSCLMTILTACATPMNRLQVSSNFATKDKLPPLKLVILPLEGKHEGAEFFREALHTTLMDTELNISEKFLVDKALKKNGWSSPKELLPIPPQKLGEAFGADALLYGKVTKWSKYYAIIHSTLVVGLELKLVDARTGEILWTGEELDREFEGIVKIPTGIISAFANPLIFVGEKSNLNSLAAKVARNITESLRKPYTIKEENKMDEKIVVASAKEYVKQIEENSSAAQINHDEDIFIDNDFSSLVIEDIPERENVGPSPESIKSDFIKTVEEMERDVPLPETKKQLELQETDSIVNMPEPPSAAAKKPLRDKTNSASRKKITPVAGNSYTIQVGAFQSRKYANALIEKLKKKGYKSFIAMAKIGKKEWFKVHVDRFKDRG
ncbi:MAG: DUF799 family lipoprotein, partial [Nitrospinota bacterium]|nr:DUF799 family lipoprotein [Nitrospinota bacterium]